MYFLLWGVVAFSLWHLSLVFHPLQEKVETIPKVCSWLCLVTLCGHRGSSEGVLLNFLTRSSSLN